MSALYHVLVERVTDSEVSFRVTTFHPDAGPPSAAATFPMNLLIDLWNHLDRGFQIDGCTLTAAEAKALARDPAHGPRAEALHHLTFGRRMPCSAADIAELTRQSEADEPCVLRGHPVMGWADAGDQSFAYVQGDREAFTAAVRPLVAASGIDEQTNQASYSEWPDWPGTDRLPRCRVWLRLTDPTLLGFVRPGWSFETAACY